LLVCGAAIATYFEMAGAEPSTFHPVSRSAIVPTCLFTRPSSSSGSGTVGGADAVWSSLASSGGRTVVTDRVVTLPSGTVSFLHTDIEGSTGCWERTPSAMRVALAAHDELISDVVDAHGGVVVKHLGDGCWAAFQSAPSAVEAAIDFQRRHQTTERGTGELRLDVRIGVHTGTAEPTDGDYFGPTTNRAARIVDLANGNQIVCSSSTASLLDAVELRSEGLHDLRGIGSEEVFVVLADGVETDGRPLRRPVTRGHLPRPRTSFVGREHDLLLTADFLRGGDRIVTLIGPGGVGKTRLAVEVGTRLRQEYGQQVHFCDLVPINDSSDVVERLAETIGARRQPGMDLVDSVVDFLTDRRALVILDNCEHVLDGVRTVVDRLLDTDAVQVLTTSREALRLPDEQRLDVAPLSATTDGVQLFVDRAVRRDARFDLTPANAEAVRDIVRQLDGIPLAIELAAARIRLMSPVELAVALHDGPGVLDVGTRGDRHETLHETLLWSYSLLSQSEARLFDRLSVFAGSFDLDSVVAVCADDDEVTPGATPNLLLGLVDKSMVESFDVEGRRRFRLLETMKAFAAAELSGAGTQPTYLLRHAVHYRDLAAGENQRFFSPAEPDVWRTLDAEWSNLRSAFDHFCDIDDVDSAADLVVSLVWFAGMSMRFELFGWAEELLDRAGIETHDRYTDLCGAAALGEYFTVRGGVTSRAEAGLAADPSDPEGFCRVSLASVFLNNVHTAEASAELTADWLASEPATTGGLLWASGFRVMHLCTHDPSPEAAVHVETLDRLATETGSVTARALAAWAAGQVISFEDIERGVQTWMAGREWSNSVPTPHLVDQLLVGLILHVTARSGDLKTTLLGCRRALGEALERHYHVGTSHLFGVTAIALCRAGDASTGAQIVGTMIENGHLPRRNAQRELERALGDELDDHLALGRNLTITQAAGIAIEALDRALQQVAAEDVA